MTPDLALHLYAAVVVTIVAAMLLFAKDPTRDLASGESMRAYVPLDIEGLRTITDGPEHANRWRAIFKNAGLGRR
jgi:hypothetical protein